MIFLQDELEGKPSSDEGSDFESSSDDDREFAKEMQKQHRLIRRERREREEEEEEEERVRLQSDSSKIRESIIKQPKFFELRSGEEFKGLKQGMKRKHVLK